VLDIAPRLTHRQLSRLVNDARHDGHLRPASLQDVMDRNPLHPAAKLLAPFVENPHNPTYSDFEDDFLAFVATYDLPTPEINFPLDRRAPHQDPARCHTRQ
jgi:hypothetical protein